MMVDYSEGVGVACQRPAASAAAGATVCVRRGGEVVDSAPEIFALFSLHFAVFVCVQRACHLSPPASPQSSTLTSHF